MSGKRKTKFNIKNKNLPVGQKNNEKVIEGIIRKTRSGYGFLENENMEKDIFIGRNHMGTAMEGDRALVELIPESLWEKGPEGFVIKVVNRNIREVVGTLEKHGNNGFLIPINNKLKEDIYIPKRWLKGANNGDKVVVELKEYPKTDRLPEGKIVKIISRAKDSDRDVMAILIEHDVTKEFKPEVETEAKKIVETVLESPHYDKRLDFRGEEIVTIDGKYSKDLDDGVSIKINEKGNYVLGVHIADVSAFVPEGSSLDEEALNRGNSIYLINHVVPMLPKILSNNICSLSEGEDRLAISCITEIDNKGNIVDYNICESIINSKGRLVYDEVSDYLENGKVSKKVKSHSDTLKLMENLALILKKSREGQGSIDFDIDEPEFEILNLQSKCTN